VSASQSLDIPAAADAAANDAPADPAAPLSDGVDASQETELTSRLAAAAAELPSTTDPVSRDSDPRGLAAARDAAGHLDAAVADAGGMFHAEGRVGDLLDVAAACSSRGDAAGARAALETAGAVAGGADWDSMAKPRAHARIGAAFAAAGDAEAAAGAFRVARGAAEELPELARQAVALSDVAAGMADAGRFVADFAAGARATLSAAAGIAAEVFDPAARADANEAVAACALRLGDAPAGREAAGRARDAAGAIGGGDDGARAAAYERAGALLAAAGDAPAAHDTFRLARSAVVRVMARSDAIDFVLRLCHLSRHQAAAGDRAGAHTTLATAAAAAEREPSAWLQVCCFCAVAAAHHAAGDRGASNAALARAESTAGHARGAVERAVSCATVTALRDLAAGAAGAGAAAGEPSGER
jgi:hypothetical protein